jgi:DNA uptake protein and related DNA-binding proteins
VKYMKTWVIALALLCAIGIAPAYSKEKKSQRQPAASASASPVDLNTASEADLDKLPGVGPATAKKIIAGRPYASVNDLTRSGIPAKTIQNITPLITVSQTASHAAPPPMPPANPKQQAQSTPDRSRVNTPASVNSGASPAQTPPVKGMVWVNTETKVYHREGDRWYGKTKQGKYMDESAAVKEGYRASKEK